MGTLKNLSGNVSVTVNGTLTSITDYGVPSGSSENMIAARQMSFDVGNPTTLTITGQPATGKARARSDGLLQVDLTDYPDFTGDITIDYTADAVPTTMTVSVAEDIEAKSGWGRGLHYLPKLDSSDEVVVLPESANTRFIYISATGDDRDALQAKFGGSTNTWLLSNPQAHSESNPLDETVGNSFIKSLPDGEQFFAFYKRGDTFTDFPNIKGKRGGSALHPSVIGAYGTGARPMFTATNLTFPGSHTGNFVFKNLAYSGEFAPGRIFNFVFDDILSTSNTAGGQYPLSMNGNGGATERLTFRRWQIYDAYPRIGPNNGAFWTSSDRASGMYLDNNRSILLEKMVLVHSGHEIGYNTGSRSTSGKTPDDQGHGGYEQSNNGDSTKRDWLVLSASHSAMQNRAGGIVERFFSAGNNTGINPGRGYKLNEVNGLPARIIANWNFVTDYVHTYPGQKNIFDNFVYYADNPTQLPVAGEVITGQSSGATGVVIAASSFGGCIVESEGGNTPSGTWQNGETITGNLGASMVCDSGRTLGGEFYSVTAGGINLTALETTVQRTIFSHYETGETITGTDQTGPIGDETGSEGCFTVIATQANEAPYTGTLYKSDRKQYNCKVSVNAANADLNLGGLNTVDLDATTVGAFVDDYFPVSGTAAKYWRDQLADFDTQIRTLDKPWEMLPALFEFFQDPYGYHQAVRTVAQTVQFLPQSDGATPGIRADMRDDWSTGDLPGTVAGDSVDVADYNIIWNITPANDLVNLTFGVGGSIKAASGALVLTGSINTATGGNSIEVENGATFDFSGYADSDTLTLDCVEALVVNRGAVTGVIDATVGVKGALLFGVGAGDSWNVGTGSVTVYGGTKAGFDGENGDAMSLTFGASSTLSIKPEVVIEVNNVDSSDYTGGAAGSKFGIDSNMVAKVGATLTSSGGATGVVARVSQILNTTYRIHLKDVVGTFALGETLTGDRTHEGWLDGSAGNCGTIKAAPTVNLGSIGEVVSGLFGAVAPNVVSTVTCDGTLNVDVSGVASGTYTLIKSDTLSGSFATVNITGGSATIDTSVPGELRLVV